MFTKKSRRWQFILLASFFLTLQLVSVLFAVKPAHAIITGNINGYWRVQETVVFNISQTTNPPKFDTITGTRTLVANQVSISRKGRGISVVYQTAIQNDPHAAEVPPRQFQETSTLLGSSFNCVANSAAQSAPALCGGSGNATTTDPGSGGVGNPPTTPSCETVGGGALDWLICGVFDTLSVVSNAIFKSLIVPLLRQPPIPLSDTGNNKAIFEIWSNFRIYADIFLVIALIVVVFMQAITGGTAEVYTAKKSLPKLLAAAILINLSIYIVAFMVDATNVVGAGVMQIVTAPLANNGNLVLQPGLGGGALFTAGTLLTGSTLFLALYGVPGVLVSALPFIALNVILPLVIGLVIAFLVLALRQALIILLVIVSPIAFAMWFLPNTESVFNRWWKLFFEVLMVYPIAVLIFSIFNVVAVIIGGKGGILGPIGPVIAIVIMGISLFGFLFAFRFAGQTVGKIHDVLSQRGNQLKEGIKGNVNDPSSLRNRSRRKALEGVTRGQRRAFGAGIIAQGQDTTGMNPFRRLQRRKRMLGGAVTSRIGGNIDSRISGFNKQMVDQFDQMSSTGNDRFIYAAAGYTEGGKYYNSKHEEISKLEYDTAKRWAGSGTAAMGKALNYHIQKQGQTDAGAAQFMYSLDRLAAANNWNQEEVMDVFSAATYQHKPMLGSLWYAKPQVQTSGGRTTGVAYSSIANNEDAMDTFVSDDVHKARTNPQNAAIKDTDWRAFYQHQQNVEAGFKAGGASMPDGQHAKVFAELAETFDAISYSPYATHDAEGALVSVQGVTPAAEGVIKAAINNREYGVVRTPIPGGNGKMESVNNRTIYKMADVKAAQNTWKTANPTLPPTAAPSASDLIRAGAVKAVATTDVTGDAARSRIENPSNPSSLNRNSGVAT